MTCFQLQRFLQTIGVALIALVPACSLVAAPKSAPPIVSLDSNHKLVCSPDAQGNRIPDFSHCGYAGGDRPIPNAPVRIVVSPASGDSATRIQAALDYVAALSPETNGLRGAVLLLKGRHEIFGSLRLHVSGVVLRGQGMTEDGTVLVAAGLDRRTLIRIAGRNDQTNTLGKSWEIKDTFVPVGATAFHLRDAADLKAGDTVNVSRPSTQAWIERLGMTDFGGGIGDWRLVWKPGSRDLIWDRVVKSVEGDLVTVDVPITTAIEKDFGGGRVERYSWAGRISNVGVENLRCESVFNPANLKDENHSWMAITMENTDNAWVRQVSAAHFAGSLAAIYETCKNVTVQDCLSLGPVSEEGGYRRHTFFTMGQMTLFLHCWAELGRHDFSVGHCAAGPNAFVQCEASRALGDSGAIESWASGILYDNVIIDGNGLSLANRGAGPNGAGWSAANSVLWQCSASSIHCANPPTAHNWAFGCWGEFAGGGLWRNANAFVKPDSLYAAQLADRLGPQAAVRLSLMPRSTKESSNPTIEEAAQLIASSVKPASQLKDYIATASIRFPIPADAGNARRFEDIGFRGADADEADSALRNPRSPLRITNGWLACAGRLLIGGKAEVAWWRGNIRPGEAPSFGGGLTRFVPGRAGRGYTDDLNELADSLSAGGTPVLDYHYGLWYERRRDDHERVRRASGDVWPPFYELPFARSGQGTAWDGLSRYDLARFNPWYWQRLKDFADLCDRRGLVLFHQNYFQHNILEAGAHWADCPWRTPNNVNNTGFPEPPPYAGDKRIFMAEQFYDISHPVRRGLHRAYIRQCLNNFATNSNVIQFTSAEFTGPLPFVQFWLDTIREWGQETGRKPLVALSCTKDVQDAILADAQRNQLVDLVDFRYWWIADKGLFAPKGGQNLSPRQFERQWKGGKPTDKDLAQMAAEYRQRFPDKPVICNFSPCEWAYVCAGGSLPNLPATTDKTLLAAIPRLRPWSEASSPERWVLRGPGEYLVYLGKNANPNLDLSGESGMFLAKWIDLKTGQITVFPKSIAAAKNTQLPKSPNAAEVVWLVRER